MVTGYEDEFYANVRQIRKDMSDISNSLRVIATALLEDRKDKERFKASGVWVNGKTRHTWS